MNGSEHESAFVKAFIDPQRQSRVLELLTNPKRRKAITSELAHFKWIDPRFAKPLAGSNSHFASILLLLRSKGAPETCWAISEDGTMDGRAVALEETLRDILGRGIGTVLSCVPGKLTYFEDEDGRCLLER